MPQHFPIPQETQFYCYFYLTTSCFSFFKSFRLENIRCDSSIWWFWFSSFLRYHPEWCNQSIFRCCHPICHQKQIYNKCSLSLTLSCSISSSFLQINGILYEKSNKYIIGTSLDNVFTVEFNAESVYLFTDMYLFPLKEYDNIFHLGFLNWFFLFYATDLFDLLCETIWI